MSSSCLILIKEKSDVKCEKKCVSAATESRLCYQFDVVFCFDVLYKPEDVQNPPKKQQQQQNKQKNKNKNKQQKQTKQKTPTKDVAAGTHWFWEVDDVSKRYALA